MTKLTSENNIRITYDSDSTTRKLNMETTIEIGYEFVKILQDNAFNGIDEAGIANHIAKVLEISEWIKNHNADKDQLRLHVFPISLNGRAREWWDNEIKDTVTTWKELNCLEFLEWLGSKFENHWNMDENTKHGLWNFYVNDYNTEGSISNTEPSKDECDEPYKKSPRKSCSESFFKPYLDAQEGNGIYNFEENNQHFPQIQSACRVNSWEPNMILCYLKNSRSSDTR
ncbi:hypothetical protein Tco_0379597 [Tanacetum coccineum]